RSVRANDISLGGDVAVEILPASFTSDPDRVARFRREAQILASLNHPHMAGPHPAVLYDDVLRRRWIRRPSALRPVLTARQSLPVSNAQFWMRAPRHDSGAQPSVCGPSGMIVVQHIGAARDRL